MRAVRGSYEDRAFRAYRVTLGGKVQVSAQELTLLCSGIGIDVVSQDLILTCSGPGLDIVEQQLVLDLRPTGPSVPIA